MIQRKIRTNRRTKKTLYEMGKNSKEQISYPSADKARRNKMEKYTNRNNVPAIGEI
jgi:hypothetical protein